LAKQEEEGFEKAVTELGGDHGNPDVEAADIQAQPQPLDGVEVRGTRRQELRGGVMPVESLDLVPGGVVEHVERAALRLDNERI
jgi:hypothetical protein